MECGRDVMTRVRRWRDWASTPAVERIIEGEWECVAIGAGSELDMVRLRPMDDPRTFVVSRRRPLVGRFRGPLVVEDVRFVPTIAQQVDVGVPVALELELHRVAPFQAPEPRRAPLIYGPISLPDVPAAETLVYRFPFYDRDWAHIVLRSLDAAVILVRVDGERWSANGAERFGYSPTANSIVTVDINTAAFNTRALLMPVRANATSFPADFLTISLDGDQAADARFVIEVGDE